MPLVRVVVLIWVAERRAVTLVMTARVLYMAWILL